MYSSGWVVPHGAVARQGEVERHAAAAAANDDDDDDGHRWWRGHSFGCRLAGDGRRINAGVWKHVAQTATQESHPQMISSVSAGQIEQGHSNHHINKDHLAEELNFTAGDTMTKDTPEFWRSRTMSNAVSRRINHVFIHLVTKSQSVYCLSAECGIQELNELG